MFFGSVTRGIHEASSPKWLFVRDLAASLASIGALGALLMAIQLHSGVAPSAQPSAPVVKSAAAQKAALKEAAVSARQPSDEAATPNADEERIARAMIAFALSKVSPLQPEPMASIPATPAPLASAFPSAKKIVKPQISSRSAPNRVVTGLGQGAYVQPEWPARQSAVTFSATPKDQPALVAASRLDMARFVPTPETFAVGARNIAIGARKTVDHGMSGLRSGVSAVHEKALAVAGKLW